MSVCLIYLLNINDAGQIADTGIRVKTTIVKSPLANSYAGVWNALWRLQIQMNINNQAIVTASNESS